MTGRDDIDSGDVWPDVEDLQRERDYLEQRCAELTDQLAAAERLCQQHDDWAHLALKALDDVVARLTAEQYGPPPAQRTTPTEERGDGYEGGHF